jgi:hypothetical protein
LELFISQAISTITPEDCKNWFEACYYYWRIKFLFNKSFFWFKASYQTSSSFFNRIFDKLQ